MGLKNSPYSESGKHLWFVPAGAWEGLDTGHIIHKWCKGSIQIWYCAFQEDEILALRVQTMMTSTVVEALIMYSVTTDL